MSRRSRHDICAYVDQRQPKCERWGLGGVGRRKSQLQLSYGIEIRALMCEGVAAPSMIKLSHR